MKLHLSGIGSLALLPFLFGGAGLDAAAEPSAAVPAAAAPHSLSGVAGNGVKITGDSEETYDFGTLPPMTTQPIRHDFVIHNSTAAPVQIDRVQAMCGCTTATPDNGTEGAYQPVAPGKDLTVHVSVDPGHLYPGHIDKLVWIYLKGESQPAMTLRITGVMTPTASFDPLTINFGSIHAGATPSAILTAVFDKQIFGENPPDLVPSAADVKLSRIGADQHTADGKQITRKYKVSVASNARLGPLQVSISTPPSRNPYANGASSVEAVGTVTGDLNASPGAVVFPTLQAGQRNTQQVILTSTSPKALQGLTVKCDDPAIKVRLIPAADHQPSATVEVTFAPKSTLSVQTEVTVTTKSGQVLAIPVWATAN